jgi:CheY-like chemotaxis protein
MDSGRSILLVEDNRTEAEALSLILGEEGYSVNVVANGRDALDYLASNAAPRLILLDMAMPVLDGWHFLAEVNHRQPPLPSPIIVTTSTVISREWALTHGCAGFLHKPVEPEAIAQEVRRCLKAA